MKQKITLLITGCFITVAALACIQGYFIYNTYKLYAKEADAAIRRELLELETNGNFDAVNAVWMRQTEDFIGQYYRGESTKDEYVKRMSAISNSLSQEVAEFIVKQRFFEGYNVSYNNYISTITIFEDRQKADTLFSEKILLYGNGTDNAKEIPASQSHWNGTVTKFGVFNESRNFEVVTRRTYSIANWQEKVALKMLGMLIFTIVLLAFVVLLFYLSIKSLITQKKIADIKTDFINNITHEFQTPIAAMDIAVATLQRKEQELTAPQFTNTLSIINRQNQRMQKLFRQVTDASVSSDIINTANAEILGCDTLNEIVHDFTLANPNVIINCPDNANTKIYIDRFHLATIVINLLDNAIKYGGSSITINLQNLNNCAVLAVSDNGIGIPQKEKTAIFEKFYRVQKGDIHTTKGLGLGLHYVRQITEAYKGTVAVTDNENGGSIFTIVIPLV